MNNSQKLAAIPVGKNLGVMTVRGTVTGALPTREFKASNVKSKTVQDYYHVLMKTEIGNFAKIYFPVVTCSTQKYGNARSIDISIRDERSGNWIKHDLKNPRLLVGKTVEVVGDVKKEGDKHYYVNRITVMKIF